MHLENSEPCSPTTVGEERPARAVLTGQCQTPLENVLGDLANPAKKTTNPIKEDSDDQIVCNGEIQTAICSSDSFSTDEEEPESSFCSWKFESLERLSAAGDGLGDFYQIVDQFESAGLSQPFDERAQRRESFEPCNSPEDCANHSLTSERGPRCEHCAEHLGSSQQCELPNQQCDPGPEEEATWRGTFGECEIPPFMHDEYSEELEALQHEPSDQQDQIRDSEPEDCEESDDQMPYQSECSDGDLPEDHDALEEEESGTHCDSPDDFYLDESRDVSPALECAEVYQEGYQVADSSSDRDDESVTQSETQPGYETTEKTSDFFSEEDGSSDCSSVESKSFQTCLGSIPSDPCSDSSEESDKGAQEDSGDEQMQWESFEEDEDLQQSHSEELNEDSKETPIVDIIIEDYFDLFDRHDHCGWDFAPKRHYVSCFDGGDIHARLRLEEINYKAQKVGKNTQECKETSQDSCLRDQSDQAAEDPTDDRVKRLGESEKEPDDWIAEPESSSAEDDVESHEAAAAEEEGEVSVFCSCDLESCDHTTEEVGQFDGQREKMCPPFVNDISVEGDAYEDDELVWGSGSASCGSPPTCPAHQSESTADSEDYDIIVCSEMEPYWFLASHDSIGLIQDPYVEDYYAYQIRSVEVRIKQALGGFTDCSHHQICEEDDSESQAQLDREQGGKSSVELNRDGESREAAGEKTLPSGVIHSVASGEEGEGLEQSPDEESDDESCDCEYCLAPGQQVRPNLSFFTHAQQV